MSPRKILYIGFVIALFPLFSMWQYATVILAVDREFHDPQVLRQLTENMAMLGMFSWPIWLGLAAYSVLRWRFFLIYERILSWVPMVLFLGCYILVLTH